MKWDVLHNSNIRWNTSSKRAYPCKRWWAALKCFYKWWVIWGIECQIECHWNLPDLQALFYRICSKYSSDSGEFCWVFRALISYIENAKCAMNSGGIREICDTFSVVKVVELEVEYSFPLYRKFLQITIVPIMPIPIMPNPIISNNICEKKNRCNEYSK